ncbi:MAG TPA: hypothetical protein H9958_06725 [Candidatus Limosilactobacillus intestinavium]|nr:hypothetical protein [Candidatus Limosilactobacillus intestinavium]
MEHYESLKDLSKQGFSPELAVHSINKMSREAALRWSKDSFEHELAPGQRLSIGMVNNEVSDLTKLRLYELRDALHQWNIDSHYWFVVDQVAENIWTVENPFIMRHFHVIFSGGQIKQYQYKSENAKYAPVKTKNLIEAILLTQI